MADFGEDSDDSDGEGGLGNVSRIIMRPIGHSGKAKRGHLCFDASFETGNLGRVDLINEYEYDLFIRPDTCSPMLRFWFNFTVDNVKQDQKVIFNIVNLSKERNLFMDNMTPLVKSSSRPKWQRIPKQYVFYHKSPLHQNQYILSFSFGFDKEDDVFQFSLAPPYSYTRLQTFLNVLEIKSSYLNENLRRDLLEKSVQNRRLDLITIGSLDRREPMSKRRVIAIMARAHPGESPSSFVCQGLLELLTSSNTVASVLRKYVIFKVIPMLNPDGVFLGNYRSTVMGADLNRSWHIINNWCHPTIKAARDVLTTLDKNKEFQLDFVIDIHAHSSLRGCFVYGNTYEDVYRYERHILFPKLLATVADDYVSNNTMFNSDSNKNGSARRFLCSYLSDRVNCYTFEVSIFGYKLKGSEITIPYTEESFLVCDFEASGTYFINLKQQRTGKNYCASVDASTACAQQDMRCGRNLVKTFLEYYQNTGAIPIQLSSEIGHKRPLTNQMRRRNKNRYQRSLTSRTQAQLHFQNLNITYDSETSIEDHTYSYRYASPQKTFENQQSCMRVNVEKNYERKQYRSDSPPSTTYVVPPEPSLSIIDFNVISRDEIEKLSVVNKLKVKKH